MSHYFGVPWTGTETDILLDGLRRCNTLSAIRANLPARTEGAVLHRANIHGHGHDTVADAIIFRPYIKHVHRRTKEQIKADNNECS